AGLSKSCRDRHDCRDPGRGTILDSLRNVGRGHQDGSKVDRLRDGTQGTVDLVTVQLMRADVDRIQPRITPYRQSRQPAPATGLVGLTCGADDCQAAGIKKVSCQRSARGASHRSAVLEYSLALLGECPGALLAILACMQEGQ